MESTWNASKYNSTATREVLQTDSTHIFVITGVCVCINGEQRHLQNSGSTKQSMQNQHVLPHVAIHFLSCCVSLFVLGAVIINNNKNKRIITHWLNICFMRGQHKTIICYRFVALFNIGGCNTMNIQQQTTHELSINQTIKNELIY